MSRNYSTLRWSVLPLVAFLSCKEASDPGLPATAASSSASANNGLGSSAALALSAPEWPRQGQLTYSLELASRMTLQGGVLTDLLLKGNVLLQARALDGAPAAQSQASQLWVTFSDVTLSSTQQAAEAEFKLVTEQLKRPFLVAVENGLVTKLWLDGSAVPFTQGLQRTLASALQFAPAAGAGPSWTREEVDATGRYLAEYTAGAASDVKKRKQKYLTVTLPRGAERARDSKLAAEVLESQWNLSFSEGRLAAVDYREVVRARPLPNAAMETSTRFALKLTAFEAQALQGDWAAQLARLKLVAADEALVAGPSQAVLDAARMGQRSFEEVLQALEQGSKQGKLPPERVNDIAVSVTERSDAEQSVRQNAEAYHALTAMLRQRPGTLEKVKQAVQRKSPAQQMLLDALSSAGTPEAQGALREFVAAAQPSATRVAAATSLIRVALPEPETVNTLTALLSDSKLRTHGLYGLGTACRHLREAGQTDAATAVGGRLRAELREAKSEVATVQALRAIANSGHTAALAEVRPLLSHDNPSLRGAAVEALRLMPLPEVDVIIAERLGTETEDKALFSVINAVSTRDPGEALSKALDGLLRNNKSPHVRLEALRVVSVWAEHRPELLATLAYLAEHDDKPRISSLAAARVAELSPPAKTNTTP